MTATVDLFPEDGSRDAALIWEAVLAVAGGPANAGHAAELTTRLIWARQSPEVYGVFCGAAEYAVRAAAVLNGHSQVGPAPHGGPWCIGDLRPPAEESEDADPGVTFARRFTDTYAAGGLDSDETVRLYNEAVVGGVAWLCYCLAHLVADTAEVVGAAAKELTRAGLPVTADAAWLASPRGMR